MERFIRQIKKLVPKERKYLHKIYEKTIRDHAYIWDELEDIAHLREILLVIFKLFIEEHKGLHDSSQIDQEKFNKKFRKLLSDRDALLQKGRQYQVKEINAVGMDKWLEQFWFEIHKLDKLIESWEEGKDFTLFKPEEVNTVKDARGKRMDSKIKPLVIALWKKGIKTENSCQGHFLEKEPYPWVRLCYGQDISNLKRWIDLYNKKSEIKWEILKGKNHLLSEDEIQEIGRQGKDKLLKHISENQVISCYWLKPINSPEKANLKDKFKIFFSLTTYDPLTLRKMQKNSKELAEFIESQ